MLDRNDEELEPAPTFPINDTRAEPVKFLCFVSKRA